MKTYHFCRFDCGRKLFRKKEAAEAVLTSGFGEVCNFIFAVIDAMCTGDFLSLSLPDRAAKLKTDPAAQFLGGDLNLLQLPEQTSQSISATKGTLADGSNEEIDTYQA